MNLIHLIRFGSCEILRLIYELKNEACRAYVKKIIFKKQKTCTVFVSSYRNMSASLGEREMLWVFPQLFRGLLNFHE